MARVWRDGQKKTVYIYRLLTTVIALEFLMANYNTNLTLAQIVGWGGAKKSEREKNNEGVPLFPLRSALCATLHCLNAWNRPF